MTTGKHLDPVIDTDFYEKPRLLAYLRAARHSVDHTIGALPLPYVEGYRDALDALAAHLDLDLSAPPAHEPDAPDLTQPDLPGLSDLRPRDTGLGSHVRAINSFVNQTTLMIAHDPRLGPLVHDLLTSMNRVLHHVAQR